MNRFVRRRERKRYVDGVDQCVMAASALHRCGCMLRCKVCLWVVVVVYRESG
jgi:hypothetical protein